MERSYLAYAMSVIASRALPDVRDGLKPVQRRILFAMREMGFTPEKQHRKCAGIVGEVLKSYHPHGDSSVYDALVRMAQDFTLRYPLVDGHGNFGSIDGDPPAAYRYTEARLARAALEMLAEIDRETVDFIPNFDNQTTEPTVLPSRLPNLLVNGSSGIAVGMATNIPPHNVGEICDAIALLLDNPKATDEELQRNRARTGFPDRRRDHGPRSDSRSLQNRPRLGRHSRKSRDRRRARQVQDHHHRSAVPGYEIPHRRGDRRSVFRQAHCGHHRLS